MYLQFPLRRLDCMFTIIYIYLNAYVFKISLKEAGLYVYNNIYLLECICIYNCPLSRLKSQQNILQIFLVLHIKNLFSNKQSFSNGKTHIF